MDSLPIPLLRILYPVPPPTHTRQNPMKVLCLGLGRTGTESLRLGLEKLGYSNVHHGFRLAVGDGVRECAQWYRLGRSKFATSARNLDGTFSSDTTWITREEFDLVLGDCEATCDLPSAAFGVELLRAYPEAQVVLNRRSDLEEWYNSQLATVDTVYRDYPSWLRQWVEPESFWITQQFQWCFRGPFGFDFKANGRAGYVRHYAELEDECKDQGREWLYWTVEDGWGPLCGFLGRAVPEGEAFPRENGGKGFVGKRQGLHAGRVRRAWRNVAVGGAVLSIAFGAWMFPGRWEALVGGLWGEVKGAPRSIALRR